MSKYNHFSDAGPEQCLVLFFCVFFDDFPCVCPMDQNKANQANKESAKDYFNKYMYFNSFLAGQFCMLFRRLLFFFKINFFEKFFRNTIRASNSLESDPDSILHKIAFEHLRMHGRC